MESKSNYNQGFTLIEMLITAGLFAITSVLVGGVFINVNNLQQQTANMQKLQNDGRYMIEKIGREIRGRELDYERTLPPVDGKVDRLIFKKDEAGEIWQLAYDPEDLTAKIFITTLNPDGTVFAPLNASDVGVSNLQFIVSPIYDPYAGITADDYIYQPKITLLMSIYNKNAPDRYRKELRLQTTISSKVYH
ncbi:MAG: prepilin-type N-terminal cleavage/methylation domain-containing protein [Patescibacteria group bacterium]|jgi:prepilin-type N-terminal cleavage/methylation domain-containing protein